LALVGEGRVAGDHEEAGDLREIGDEIVAGSVEVATIPDSNVKVYLIANDDYFNRPELYGESGKDYEDNIERFTFFCRGILQFLKKSGIKPDILHCNDWQSALIPIYLKTTPDTFYSGMKTLYTIHNLAYQGIFPKEQLPLTGLGPKMFTIDGLEYYGNISLAKGGLLYADHLSTVSQKYSEEIQTPEFGCRLDGVLRVLSSKLDGILNGVDYNLWNPETDALIVKNFSPTDLSGKAACKKDLQKIMGLKQDPKTPLLSVISRLADQKGFDLLAEIVDYVLGLGVQFVLLGTGSPDYHQLFTELAERYPKQVGVALKYDNTLAHKIEAGSDIFLMPSRYEPCGLNQMYSLKYGTIPVVRATGGLADTITEYDPKTKRGNGFVFVEPEPKPFYFAIKRAIDTYHKTKTWNALVKRAMKMDFSWDVSAKKYEALYERMASAE